MTVAGRLTAAFGLLLLLLVGMAAYQVRATRRAVATAFALARAAERVEQDAAARQDALDRMEETASKFAVTGDPRYRAGLADAVAAFDEAIRGPGESASTSPAGRELAQLRQLWNGTPGRVDALAGAVRSGDRGTQARTAAIAREIAGLRAQSRRLGDASRAGISDRLARAALAEQKSERVSLALALGALLLSIAVAAWIVRSVAEPLRRLSKATHHVAEGRFDYPFALPRDPQFARLAGDFKRMTERLAEIDRVKQQFLSRISHDLKTPLASIQETSRVLLDDVAGPLTPDQRRLLQLSLESGERLSAMIGKILELSALQAGAHALERAPRDLRVLAARAAELATPALAKRRVAIECVLPDQPVVADCDDEGVLRILDNLLENAGRFSPEGASVRVRVGYAQASPMASSRPLLAVEDAGPGVPREHRERIFEPFVQPGQGRPTRRGGVGLGLAICREIALAHDGSIRVEDAPDGGTRFVVELPAADCAPRGTEVAL